MACVSALVSTISSQHVPFPLFSFLLFSYLVLLLSAGDGIAHFTKCPPSFDCGNLGPIYFPFTTTKRPDCGLMVIHGCEDDDPGVVKSIKNKERWFTVKKVQQFPPTITVRDEEDDDFNELVLSRDCGAFDKNLSVTPSSPFASFQIKSFAPFFRCIALGSISISAPEYFSKYTCPKTKSPDYNFVAVVYYLNTSNYESLNYTFPSSCATVQLPIRDDPNPGDPFQMISANISIQVNVNPNCSSCYYAGGQCRQDKMGVLYCHKGKSSKTILKVSAAASAGVVGLLIVLAWCFREKISLCLWKKKHPTYQVIENFLKERGHLPAKRYSYLEVKKMTNFFRNKLGQGGYGSVYKGKLLDGSLVAVKVLSELKGNGEEFINEVASISMTSHVNIVSLVGFCLEASKRALIYEFMPNGSLEKFIYEEKDPSKLHLQLRCRTMYNIAIGVARGLEYLHKGCNTTILHFDIKPHNILLDEDFGPKVSDFGLAKICPRKESHVSLFGARGTAGYIAPEVFSRTFGGVSHKSDVYSYGMMVIEMVGGRKNINVDVNYSSEIYLPHWIHKRLELNQELGLRCIKNESDNEMVRKMVILSLWCIQTDPSKRPAMSKVVEMLEGSLESLQVPPKPFLASPPTSPTHQTQTSETERLLGS